MALGGPAACQLWPLPCWGGTSSHPLPKWIGFNTNQWLLFCGCPRWIPALGTDSSNRWEHHQLLMSSLPFQGDSEVFALASCPLHLLTTCQCCYCSRDRWKNKASQDGSQIELTTPNRFKSTWRFGVILQVTGAALEGGEAAPDGPERASSLSRDLPKPARKTCRVEAREHDSGNVYVAGRHLKRHYSASAN